MSMTADEHKQLLKDIRRLLTIIMGILAFTCGIVAGQ